MHYFICGSTVLNEGKPLFLYRIDKKSIHGNNLLINLQYAFIFAYSILIKAMYISEKYCNNPL